MIYTPHHTTQMRKFVFVAFLLLLALDPVLSRVGNARESASVAAVQPDLSKDISHLNEQEASNLFGVGTDPHDSHVTLIQDLMSLLRGEKLMDDLDGSANVTNVSNVTKAITPDSAHSLKNTAKRDRQIAIDAMWMVVKRIADILHDHAHTDFENIDPSIEDVAKVPSISQTDKKILMDKLQWPLVNTIQHVVTCRTFRSLFRSLKLGSQSIASAHTTEQRTLLLEWLAADPSGFLDNVRQLPAVKELLSHRTFLEHVELFVNEFVRPTGVNSSKLDSGVVSMIEKDVNTHTDEKRPEDDATDVIVEEAQKDLQSKSFQTTKVLIVIAGAMIFLFLMDLLIRTDSSNFPVTIIDLQQDSIPSYVRSVKMWLAFCLVGFSSFEMLWRSLKLMLTSQDSHLKLKEAVGIFLSDKSEDDDGVSLLQIEADENSSKATDTEHSSQNLSKQEIEDSMNDERIKQLAERMVDEFEKRKGIGLSKFRELVKELGFKQKSANQMTDWLENLGKVVTKKELLSKVSQRSFGIEELIHNGGGVILLTSTACLCLGIAMLLTTQVHLDLLLGVSGVGMLLLVMTVVLIILGRVLARGENGQSQVNSYFSTVLENGTAKISTMITIVMLFAFAEHVFLRTCQNASPQCSSNNALPVCTATGLPPALAQCDDSGNIQCYGEKIGDMAICPDENIPGAISDQGLIVSTLNLNKPSVSIGATNSSLCSNGIFSALCQRAHRYTYGPPGALVDVVNPFSNAGLGGSGVISEIAVAERGSDCSGIVTTIALANFGIKDLDQESSVPLYTPTKSTGVAVYDLCYKRTNTTNFQILRGPTPSDPLHVMWDAYLIIGDVADCSSKDCSSSDFTETMSKDMFDSVYFSMITHSSIGFGDISPTSTRGMMIVSLQCVIIIMIGLL